MSTLRTFTRLSHLAPACINTLSPYSTYLIPVRYKFKMPKRKRNNITPEQMPVSTLFGDNTNMTPESQERKDAIVHLTRQLDSSALTPSQLDSLLTLAKQHQLTYFITSIASRILSQQHQTLYQHAKEGEWDKCESLIRDTYNNDANKLPHYEALPLPIQNPYEIEKTPRPFTLFRRGMKLHNPNPTPTPPPPTDSLQSLVNMVARAKLRKAEERAAAETTRLENLSKQSFPEIQSSPTTYPITFFHVIELLDACGWDVEARAAYQHAIDSGYIVTPLKMTHSMIYALQLPRRVASLAVRTWLHDTKQKYDILKQLPKENLQIILGKGWRGKYDNPMAALIRHDIVTMLNTEYGIASELAPGNSGVLLVQRHELHKWIMSHIPHDNLIPSLPATIHVKDQSLEQATASVTSIMNEIIRQFEYGKSPEHGLQIITGVGQRYPDGVHSIIPYVPILRAPLLKLFHDTYDLKDAHITKDESSIRISRNQMERWLRYRKWKLQIPNNMQSQVQHIQPNYGCPKQTIRH